MAKNRNNRQSSYHRPNMWGMIRDIGVASLNKGQFPFALVGTFVIIVLVRLPAEELSKLVFEIFESFKSFHLMGWFLFASSVLSWYLNAKHLRKIHTNEMNRVSDEKKNLQKQLTGENLKTSNK